ncbi:B9 protein [Dictyocaulus viviparus]|uniref:B9 domain-containing protein 1 n=1 Tax=Dictyocaulus viviparus TaxID=29172 RepID=A0A0D8XIZ2_DICVI|nr:B9 protein [Dictyocaulus viviparus]
MSFGPDWRHLSGATEGLTATCYRGDSHRFVLDLPFTTTFSSTNPFKWPQLVLSCYGNDFLGHVVIRGYGALPIPTVPGSHIRVVPCFVPEASSSYQKVVGIISGRRPEFLDPFHVAKPDARYATKVTTQGNLTIRMDVILKDMKKFGFQSICRMGSGSYEAPATDLSKLTSKTKTKSTDEQPSLTVPPTDGKTTTVMSAAFAGNTAQPLSHLED